MARQRMVWTIEVPMEIFSYPKFLLGAILPL